MTEKQISKRELLKKSAYVAPAILSLKAVPSFATNGSGVTAREKGNNGVGNGIDGQPPGNPPINDGPGTGPGNPGTNNSLKSGGLSARAHQKLESLADVAAPRIAPGKVFSTLIDQKKH